MKHDKLCDEYGGDDGWGRKLECLCELIAKARADEKERIRTGVTGLPLDNAGRVDYADLLAVIDGEGST